MIQNLYTKHDINDTIIFGSHKISRRTSFSFCFTFFRMLSKPMTTSCVADCGRSLRSPRLDWCGWLVLVCCCGG